MKFFFFFSTQKGLVFVTETCYTQGKESAERISIINTFYLELWKEEFEVKLVIQILTLYCQTLTIQEFQEQLWLPFKSDNQTV